MSARVLLIDNYDSFVFNLARYFAELGAETIVKRNDAIALADVQQWQPGAIVISPGPCTPAEAGVSEELIRKCAATIPLLGVCLGHQAVASALGGRVVRAAEPVHGRTSQVEHNGTGLFDGCPNPLRVTRYHSLIVEAASLPQELEVTGRLADGTIMAIAHRRWPLWGVQFHPEAVLTASGHRLLANFLQLAGIDAQVPQSLRDPPPEPPDDAEDFYARAIDASESRPM